ncbi:MAG: hypothetical protein WEE51_08715 [Pirellulaceae bacterium]
MVTPRYKAPTFGLASLMVLVAFMAVLTFVTTPLVRALENQELQSPFLESGGVSYLMILGLLGMILGGSLGLCGRQRLLMLPAGMVLGAFLGGGATVLLITPMPLSSIVALFLAITILLWIGFGTLHIQGHAPNTANPAGALVECIPAEKLSPQTSDE